LGARSVFAQQAPAYRADERRELRRLEFGGADAAAPPLREPADDGAQPQRSNEKAMLHVLTNNISNIDKKGYEIDAVSVRVRILLHIQIFKEATGHSVALRQISV
jgi:hypothetical protein